MKNAARAIAIGRALFSVAYIALPEKINESWLGTTTPASKSAMLARSLAARDLTLSIGALVALDSEGARPELWFASHAFADATDFASTVALRSQLPASGARSGALTAGLSAVAAATVAALLAGD